MDYFLAVLIGYAIIILYSAVASNLLHLSMSRALIRPTRDSSVIFNYYSLCLPIVRTCTNNKNSIEFFYSTFLLV